MASRKMIAAEKEVIFFSLHVREGAHWRIALGNWGQRSKGLGFSQACLKITVADRGYSRK